MFPSWKVHFIVQYDSSTGWLSFHLLQAEAKFNWRSLPQIRWSANSLQATFIVCFFQRLGNRCNHYMIHIINVPPPKNWENETLLWGAHFLWITATCLHGIGISRNNQKLQILLVNEGVEGKRVQERQQTILLDMTLFGEHMRDMNGDILFNVPGKLTALIRMYLLAWNSVEDSTFNITNSTKVIAIRPIGFMQSMPFNILSLATIMRLYIFLNLKHSALLSCSHPDQPFLTKRWLSTLILSKMISKELCANLQIPIH